MKESSKVTVYYNKVFVSNYRELLGRMLKLCQEEKLILKEMEKEFKVKENCWNLIHDIFDLEDLIQRLKWEEVADKPMAVLVYLMGREPSMWLRSGIAIWKVGDRSYSANSKQEIEMIIDKIEKGEW